MGITLPPGRNRPVGAVRTSPPGRTAGFTAGRLVVDADEYTQNELSQNPVRACIAEASRTPRDGIGEGKGEGRWVKNEPGRDRSSPQVTVREHIFMRTLSSIKTRVPAHFFLALVPSRGLFASG